MIVLPIQAMNGNVTMSDGKIILGSDIASFLKAKMFIVKSTNENYLITTDGSSIAKHYMGSLPIRVDGVNNVILSDGSKLTSILMNKIYSIGMANLHTDAATKHIQHATQAIGAVKEHFRKNDYAKIKETYKLPSMRGPGVEHYHLKQHHKPEHFTPMNVANVRMPFHSTNGEKYFATNSAYGT